MVYYYRSFEGAGTLICGRLIKTMLLIALGIMIVPAAASASNYYLRGTVTCDGAPAVGALVAIDKCSDITDSSGRYFLDFQDESVVTVTATYKGKSVTKTAYMPGGGGISSVDFDIPAPAPSPTPTALPTLTIKPTSTANPTRYATATQTANPTAVKPPTSTPNPTRSTVTPGLSGTPGILYLVPTAQLVSGLAIAGIFYFKRKP